MFKFASLLIASTAAGCPDLSAFRSDSVLVGFDEAMLDGYWYENAY